MDSLPDELVMLAFDRLAPAEVQLLEFVCRRWRRLARDDVLWRHFGARGLTRVGTAHGLERAAAFAGHLDVLRWASRMRTSPSPSPEAMGDAARGGHLHVLGWGFDLQVPLEVELAVEAAGGGHVPVLEWLHVKRAPCFPERAMPRAAAGGHTGALAWLHVHGGISLPSKAGITRAATMLGAPLDAVKWLDRHGYAVDGSVAAAAAKVGTVGVASRLAARGARVPWKVGHTAARHGHVAVLEELVSIGALRRPAECLMVAVEWHHTCIGNRRAEDYAKVVRFLRDIVQGRAYVAGDDEA